MWAYTAPKIAKIGNFWYKFVPTRYIPLSDFFSQNLQRHHNCLKIRRPAVGEKVWWFFCFLFVTLLNYEVCDNTHNFINLLKRQHNYTQKNESKNLTNQQHKTLKRYLAQSTMTTYYVLRSRKFLQKFTFSIVNRNRRQIEHLHGTAGDLFWLSFENFHKCSDNSIIQGLEISRFQRTCF